MHYEAIDVISQLFAAYFIVSTEQWNKEPTSQNKRNTVNE